MATITSCIGPARSSPSTVTGPRRSASRANDGDRRPEVGDLAAERRVRRLVRPLRDRAAHARAGDVREVRLADLAASRRGRRRGRGRSSRARPSSATRTASSGFDRDAEGADEVAPGAARDDASSTPSAPGEPVDDLVDRAVAADGDEQRRAAFDGVARQLASGARAARRRARRPRRPSAAARRASSGQRRPVAPLADAGLTRKTVRSALMLVVRGARGARARVMRSTAARISSSEMRTNSPSTTTSETVSRQPRLDLRAARRA